MSMKIRVHEKKVSEAATDGLTQIMDAANYEKRGLDKQKLDNYFDSNLEQGYTHKPFDATWGSHYFFYNTYVTRPGDPTGVCVYLSLIKDEDTDKSYAYLELWDKNGNELSEPMDNVNLSDVLDAIKNIGK